jgi:NAD-dependent deacetylase
MPEAELEAAMHASSTCDVFFSIGTSALVYPAADLPFQARRHGATIVEVNPQPTPLTEEAHFVLVGAAGVVLPELVKAMTTAV